MYSDWGPVMLAVVIMWRYKLSLNYQSLWLWKFMW